MSEKTATLSTVADGLFRLSADVSNILFEGMWPIPNGVAMNSYVVVGEKVAIVDGVCGWDGVPGTLFAQLDAMGVKLTDIDFVVVNHMEPDHSGWLEDFRRLRGDDFTLVTSAKAVPLLEAFYGIPAMRVRVVGDGDTLDLGRGRVLSFVEIPNVHWPETIATFDEKTGTLMSCDAFGSFGAMGTAPYDDMLSPRELDFFQEEAVRYYSNIVATFSGPTGNAIAKVERLLGDRLKIVAPGHGIVWRADPGRIIADYKRYVRWQKGPAEAAVTVIWGSMYGNTGAALPAVRRALETAGVRVFEHRVPESHVGDILASAWRSTGIVLAMPTYEYHMFPPMAEVLDELGRKRVQGRIAFRTGSYGWSGGAQAELEEIAERRKLGWRFLEPVEFKGRPRDADLALIAERTAELAAAVKREASGA
jgi:flavorubredoxin